jgi:hypothetical protein
VRTRLASAVTAVALASSLSTQVVSAPAAGADATTTIRLKVQGCEGCKIQAVQNVAGDLPYRSRFKHVKDRRVEFVVPTERTEQMAFIVYAPFDEVAKFGFPMVVIVAFKGKQPGDVVSDAYARGVHVGSGCWAGTSEPVIDNKLVVTGVTVRHALLGPGTFTAAAGHLKMALPGLPYFGSRTKSEMHVSDPSICR